MLEVIKIEYTISQFAKLSGVSTRTLRYYDEIALLKPKRISSSGYRIYRNNEVDRLQQILFYRELEFNLQAIKELLDAKSFDIKEALEHHHQQLSKERKRLDRLIRTVEKSIQAKEGEIKMTDNEKFEAFKKDKLTQNEVKFGKEIRKKYGEDIVDRSNQKWENSTKEEWLSLETLTEKLNQTLADAVKEGNPASELGQEVAHLHKQWLMMSWPEGLYDEEKHYNISLMYVEDDRFKAYYEAIAPGAAAFLVAALKVYLNK